MGILELVNTQEYSTELNQQSKYHEEYYFLQLLKYYHLKQINLEKLAKALCRIGCKFG